MNLVLTSALNLPYPTVLPHELDVAITISLPTNPPNTSHTPYPPLPPPTNLLYLPYQTQTLLTPSSFPSRTTM